MKQLFIKSRQVYTTVDDDVFEEASKYTWHLRIGYPWTTKNGRNIGLHRMIMGVETGDPRCVDHIDGNPLNNVRSNLRICTKRQNGKNIHHIKNPSGYKGVYKVCGRYLARLTADYRQINLGTYDTPEEAALAYNEGAKLHHGEFAHLNVVRG